MGHGLKHLQVIDGSVAATLKIAPRHDVTRPAPQLKLVEASQPVAASDIGALGSRRRNSALLLMLAGLSWLVLAAVLRA